MESRKRWAASDKTMLLAKVKQLGYDAGCVAAAKILDRKVDSCKAMWHNLSKKQGVGKTMKTEPLPSPMRGDLEISFKEISVDLKNKKLIIKL